MVSINTVKSLFSTAKKAAPAVEKKVMTYAEALKSGKVQAGKIAEADNFIKTAEKTKMKVVGDHVLFTDYGDLAGRAITVRYPNGSIHTRLYGTQFRPGVAGMESIGMYGTHTYARYA